MTSNDTDLDKRILATALECQRLIEFFLKHLKSQHRLKQMKAFRINRLWRTKQWSLRHRHK